MECQNLGVLYTTVGGVKCSGIIISTLGDGQTVESYGRWNNNLVQPIGIDGSTDDKSAVSICTAYGHACILTKSQKMMCWELTTWAR